MAVIKSYDLLLQPFRKIAIEAIGIDDFIYQIENTAPQVDIDLSEYFFAVYDPSGKKDKRTAANNFINESILLDGLL